MPGGRSLGCKTCKHRKIKCDEKRPVCGQCEKSGRFCTGVLTPFVYEPEMSKAEVAEIASRRCNSSQQTLRWRPVIGAKSRLKPASSGDESQKISPPKSEALDSLERPISPPKSRLLAERLACALECTKGTGHDILVCGEWLPELACRIGHNEALDAAIDTLLLAHRDLVQPKIQDHQEQIQAYGQAIEQLKTRLQTRGDEVDIETLCAVLALCTVEIMSGSDAEHRAWLSHSGGSAAIFQTLGPRRFRTRLEKSLLYFHAAQFVSSSLVTGTSTFLDSPEWLSLLEEECEYTDLCDELQANIAPIYAAFPALMRDVRMDPSSVGNPDDLLHRTVRLRGRLLQLAPIVSSVMGDSDMVQVVSCQHPDSPFQTCYRFRSLLIAQPLLLYWRLLIIIDNTIQRVVTSSSGNDCTTPIEELKESSLEAARHIAISADGERQSRSIASAIYIFSLPAAIWVYSQSASTPEMPWLSSLLQEHLEVMNDLTKGVLVKYLDAIGIPSSCVAIQRAISG